MRKSFYNRGGIICLLFIFFRLFSFSQSSKVVLDSQTLKGVSYAVIIIDSVSYYTDSEGRFTISSGKKIEVKHVSYGNFTSILPLDRDTIFLYKKSNDIENVTIKSSGDNFKLGEIIDRAKYFYTNGAMNDNVAHYYEIAKGFNVGCPFYKINSMNIYLSDKNKSPYRINFYNQNEEIKHSLVINKKQKKGMVEIPVNYYFDSSFLIVGFEWLPKDNYKIIHAKIVDEKEYVKFTRLSFGASNTIDSKYQYYRYNPRNSFNVKESNAGLVLRLNCECFD